ncbi:MAG: murein biosynthesis integral membrane protein MurJ [Clostridia bacterium]|nr:murein biosynthesis integral membrane protein MurJ [Clostridia bacterium]
MEQAKKVLKTAGFMVVATLAAKACGMLRDMLIASVYSTGSEAVAFYTACRIPLLLFDFVIGGVISSTFIPVFNEYLEKEGKDRAMRFANLYINTVFLITLVITALGITFAPQLIRAIAPDIPLETQELSRILSNIMFPMIVFTGLAYSFVGILQSFGEFNIPSVISLVSNGSLILYFILFQDRFGIYGLAVAMLVGWGLQAVIQLPWLKKFGYRYRPCLSFRDDGIHKAAKLALPMLVSTWVQPLCTVINMRLASGVNEGAGIAALEYANKIYVIMTGLFSFVVTNLIFPYLSRASASDRQDEVSKLMVTALKTIAFLILPIMTGFMILARPITSLIYERGAFGSEDVSMTSTALMFYSVGMLTLAFCELLNKSFFAMHDSKTPMKTSIIGMVCNIILSVVLSRLMGFGGLALATALASVINAVALLFYMRRRQGKIFSSEDILNFGKIALADVVMGIAVFAVYRGAAGIPYAKLTVPVLCAAFGAVIYLAVCALLRVKELGMAWNIFVKKKKGAEHESE